MSQRLRSTLRKTSATPLEAVMLITVLVVASAIWALWTLASTPPTSGPAMPMSQLARGLAPLTLWSLLVTVPALAVMWRFALRDQSRVLKTRANRAELGQLTADQFERWCAVRLEAMGYSVRRVAGSRDHGIDLVAERDNAVTVVQCKRNTARRRVGEPQVRDLYGAMHDQRAAGALLMSAGSITAAAREWARGKPIELWDVEALVALPSPVPDGAASSQPPVATRVQRSQEATPATGCPNCGGALVVRTNRSSRAQFFGCSTWPKCNYTRPL